MVDTQLFSYLLERARLSEAQFDNTEFNQVNFSKGFFSDCFSIEKAPTFNGCCLDRLVIEYSDLSNAHFNKSCFIGAIIWDSDFNQWQLDHTAIDTETSIENCGEV